MVNKEPIQSPNNVQNKKQQPEKKKYQFDFDELKMYFREPYMIKMENDKYIEIMQPSIGDILQLGDREVYATISPFITNTTSQRVQLWDMGIDWNKKTDYELFAMLVPLIQDVSFLCRKVEYINNPDYNNQISEAENLKLGIEPIIKVVSYIDFSKLEPYILKQDVCEDEEEMKKKFILYDPDQDVVITEETYMHLREYIRMMFDQHPKEEFAKGKLAKLWIINEEKDKLKREAEKNDGKRKSILLPMVSALLNHPGFKYDLDGMKNLGIFAFMDCARRLQLYEQCTAFLGGMYSGMMDTSKLGQEELNKRVNWLQDLYKEDL